MLALVAALLMPGVVSAQTTAGGWSQPENVFETEGRASEVEVAADASGVVHVFWAYGAPGAEESGEVEAIYYAWLENGRWSEPVDVLVSPGGRVARFHSVVVDPSGYLHVVWSGGNALYYSRAFAPEAGSALSWTEPAALVSGVSALEPGLAVDGQGILYVVWTQASAGLMFARSEDGGRSWSAPNLIFPAEQGNELARWGRIAVDVRGRLHVALTFTRSASSAASEQGNPNYLYYLRSEDQGETWSAPFLVTPEPDFGEMNVATYGDDVVHLLWNGRAGTHGRYHRWSENGGQTWSDTQAVVRPAPQDSHGTGGLTGYPALTVDAAGALHMVTATGGGDYYYRWQDGLWSEPALLSPGLRGDGVTGEDISLEQPSIAINRGSELHVVFHDGFERIWHVAGGTGLPEARAAVLPGAESPTPEAATALTSSEGEPVSAVLAPAATGPQRGLNPAMPMLAAAAPAMLLILLVALVRRRSR
jgi:hypothetical protein